MTELLPPAILLFVAAVITLGAFSQPGSEFDEGILVSFPVRVLQGAVPYRDFELFYGPANTYVVAGVFDLFGASLDAERAVGLFFDLVAILAVYVLGRSFGRAAAIAAGLIAVVLLAGHASAGAEREAQAAALSALAIAAVAARRANGSELLSFVAGLVAGVALLFRLELAPAVVLTAALVLAGRRRIGPWLVGLGLGLIPYAVVLFVVGFDKLRRNFDDLRETGHDRRLPIPGPGTDAGRLLIVSLLATAALLAVGAWQTRRQPERRRGRLILAIGVYAAAITPFGFWRADAPHILEAGLVPLSLLPATLAFLPNSARRSLTTAGLVALILVVLLTVPDVRGALHDGVRGDLGQSMGYRVSYGGRSFVIASRQAADDLTQVLSALGDSAKPGQTLFVGPRDLRRTNTNDAFVYYLFPKLAPASFYIELDPLVGFAAARLARDLEHANYLILTSRWASFNEPNASSRYGPPLANDVVHKDFCTLAIAGTYSLLRRCR